MARVVRPLMLLHLVHSFLRASANFFDTNPSGEPLPVTFPRQKELLCQKYPTTCCPPTFDPHVFAYDSNGLIMNGGMPLTSAEDSAIAMAASYRVVNFPEQTVGKSDRLIFWIPLTFLADGKC